MAERRDESYASKVTTIAQPTSTSPAVKAVDGQRAASGPLTGQQIVERLTGLPPGVAEQIFKLSEAQVVAEIARQQRIDVKSTSLLTAVGLSLTVAFTFGSVLLKDGWNYWKDPDTHGTVVLLFGGAMATGIFAALFALAALLVTKYPGLNEAAVFNEAILKQVRDLANDVDVAADDATRAAAEATALANYRMSMTIQMVKMVQEIRGRHDVKTRRILIGQCALVGFLVVLTFLFGFLGYAAYFVHP